MKLFILTFYNSSDDSTEIFGVFSDREKATKTANIISRVTDESVNIVEKELE